MYRFKLEDRYIIPEEDLGYIEVIFNDINKKRLKLIERGRLTEDFPKIDYVIKRIDIEELKKQISESEILTTLQKMDYRKNLATRRGNLLQLELKQDKMPTLEGWKVLGLLEKADKYSSSNHYIINSFNKNEPIPNQYRHVDPCNCDHCGQRRDRNQTFIIQNDNTKEYLQVGSACMKDFVKEQSLQMLMLYSSVNSIFNEYLEQGTKGEYISYVNRERLLEAIVMLDEKLGGKYISKKNEKLHQGLVATSRILNSIMDEGYFNGFLRELSYEIQSENCSVAMATQIKSQIQNLAHDFLNMEPTDEQKNKVKDLESFYKNNPPTTNDNEFYINMYTLMTADDPYINSKYVGRLSYVLEYYKKILDNLNPKPEVEKENILKSETYLATRKEVEEGVKVEEMIVSLENISTYDSQFGLTAYHTFRTLDGKKLKWSASNRLECFPYEEYEDYMSMLSKINLNKNEGNKTYMKLSFSITELKTDQKGVPETKISRAKIIPNELGECKIYTDLSELTKDNYINIKGKYILTEFKVLEIEKGHLSKGLEGYKITVELRDGNKKQIFSMNDFNMKEGDIFKAPVKYLGSEIVSLKLEKMKNIPSFTMEEEFELTDTKYEKYDPNEKPKIKIAKSPKNS